MAAAASSRDAVQVLIDADNVHPTRIAALLQALADPRVRSATHENPRIVVAGRATALAATEWPPHAELREQAGWQRADAALADAYINADAPLVVASGDGDFVQLVAQHAGPVLVVAASRSTAGRMRDHATVIDPVLDGVEPLVQWLAGT